MNSLNANIDANYFYDPSGERDGSESVISHEQIYIRDQDYDSRF
jgi:hypothetical protein